MLYKNKNTINDKFRNLIIIDALYDDLIIELKNDKFAELIKDYLMEFSNTLQKK